MNIRKSYLTALALLVLVPTVSNVQGVEANVPKDPAATAIAKIDPILDQKDRNDETAGREIIEIIDSIASIPVNEHAKVIKHILNSVQQGRFVNDSKAITKIYDVFFKDREHLSSDDMNVLATLYVENRENLVETYALRRLTYDLLGERLMPHDNYLKAIYTLRNDLKSDCQSIYKPLQGLLTPGMHNSLKDLEKMGWDERAVILQLQEYKKNIKKANAVLEKHGISLPLSTASMMKLTAEDKRAMIDLFNNHEPGLIERFTNDYYKDMENAFAKFHKIKALDSLLLRKMKSRTKLNSQCKDTFNEVHKYVNKCPAKILRGKFEDALGVDIARTFFIELGICDDHRSNVDNSDDRVNKPNSSNPSKYRADHDFNVHNSDDRVNKPNSSNPSKHMNIYQAQGERKD